MNNEFIIHYRGIMAQRLKSGVRESILDAAIDCFFERGLQNSSMSDIAGKAGIAVGNLYRYFKDKEDIFYSSITDENIKNLKKIIEFKFKKSHGMSVCPRKMAEDVIQNELIELIASNRKYWYIVFLKSEGTKYSNIKEESTLFLTGLFRQYIESINKESGVKISEEEKFLSTQVYRSLIDSFCSVLKENNDVDTIKALCRRLLSYHFAGLEALFPAKEK